MATVFSNAKIGNPLTLSNNESSVQGGPGCALSLSFRDVSSVGAKVAELQFTYNPLNPDAKVWIGASLAGMNTALDCGDTIDSWGITIAFKEIDLSSNDVYSVTYNHNNVETPLADLVIASPVQQPITMAVAIGVGDGALVLKVGAAAGNVVSYTIAETTEDLAASSNLFLCVGGVPSEPATLFTDDLGTQILGAEWVGVNDIAWDLGSDIEGTLLLESVGLEGELWGENTTAQGEIVFPRFELEGVVVVDNRVYGELELPLLELEGAISMQGELALSVLGLEGSVELDNLLQGDLILSPLELEGALVTGEGKLDGELTIAPLELEGALGMQGELELPLLGLEGSALLSNTVQGELLIPSLLLEGSIILGNVAEGELLFYALESVQGVSGALEIPIITMSGEMAQAMDPVGSYAMNVRTSAVTTYSPNYVFDRIVYAHGKAYGIRQGQYYLLEGADDDGTPISASIDLPNLKLSPDSMSRFIAAVLQLKNSEGFNFQAVSDQTYTHEYRVVEQVYARPDYHTRRVKPGHGLKAHLWTIRIANRNGGELSIDGINIEEHKLRRKIRA